MFLFDDDDDADDDLDDADDDHVVVDDDNDDKDEADSCDENVAWLDASDDPILGPRKRPREEDDSPDLSNKSPPPQDSGESLQSLQKSQVPPLESLSGCVSPPEAPT